MAHTPRTNTDQNDDADPSAPETGLEAVHIVVSGRVQGVGFRAWTHRHARLLKISGWVRNREDGAVEIFAEGQKKGLDAFVEAVRTGPDYSRVEHISCEAVRVRNITGFSVVQ
jgi:acylphosphatase